ncbi:hypothetical protein BDFG_07055 [Blastomyces dermatitidis ATCC 26199]|nr:hypothetical protein BDFG_07055 [Blastomyces dermatitidis ATCC 26199]
MLRKKKKKKKKNPLVARAEFPGCPSHLTNNSALSKETESARQSHRILEDLPWIWRNNEQQGCCCYYYFAGGRSYLAEFRPSFLLRRRASAPPCRANFPNLIGTLA